jgi:cell division protein FtsW
MTGTLTGPISRTVARRQLDAARRRHPTARRVVPAPPRSWFLLVVVAVLTLFGLVMVLSASSVTALREVGSGWYFFRRQVLWTLLGTAALVVTARIDYRIWRRFIPFVLVLAFALLIAVLAIGKSVNGAKAWIALGGPFRVQPSEVAKLALLLYTADLLARRSGKMADLKATLWPPLTVLGAAAILVLAEHDLGTTIVMSSVVLAIVYLAGAPLRPLFLSTATFGAGAWWMASASPMRMARITCFLHPERFAQGVCWQLNQSLVGIASGGLPGVGLGQGRAKWGFLPEAHTDYIFAIIGEELGFIGVLIVIGLFAAFAVFGVRVALRAPDRFGLLLAGGVTAWLVSQAIVNVAGVVGLIPETGVPLPFISFGGSALVVTLAAAGLLVNVARQGRP